MEILLGQAILPDVWPQGRRPLGLEDEAMAVDDQVSPRKAMTDAERAEVWRQACNVLDEKVMALAGSLKAEKETYERLACQYSDLLFTLEVEVA